MGRMSANKVTAESAEPVTMHGFLTSALLQQEGFFNVFLYLLKKKLSFDSFCGILNILSVYGKYGRKNPS